MLKNRWQLLTITIFLFNLVLSAWWLFDGNLLFHTDIARDFFLIKDIVDNKHLTLIGARAGGLTGWFHGPLWLYLNLPAYIFGHGNPVVVGWFWFLLHIFTCYSVFFVAKKIFNSTVATVSLIVYSSLTILSVHGYINPQGAQIIFPLFFYFYWQYKITARLSSLIISLFLIGLLIQFQIAFGAPILVLTFIDNLISTIHDKKYSRFLAYFILIIPLSSYIIFELRHDFLQLRSISNFSTTSISIDLLAKIRSFPTWFWLSIPISIFYRQNIATNLFIFYYFGFWLISLLFPGIIMDYYYLPFLPILVVVTIFLLSKLPKNIFFIIIFITLYFNLRLAIIDNQKYSSDVNRQDWSTWGSVKTGASWTLDHCGPGSGYFVYTADLYGYNLRYALDYQAKQQLVSILLDQKKPTTCLLYGPNVKENPYGSDNWKSGDIKIDGAPVDSIVYDNGIKVEKYLLNPKDIQLSPNPNLIKDAFFR